MTGRSQPATSRAPLPSRAILIVLAILLVAFGLRVFRLDAQSLWWDEALSLKLALAPGLELRPTDAGHPPLYDYFILKPWVALVGSSEFATRFLSVAFGVLAVALTFNLARRLFDTTTAVVAAALVALSAIQLWYSQELRMYTLIACQTLLLLILTHRVMAFPRPRWPVWVIIGVLEWSMVYTQYLGILVVAWVNVVALAVFIGRREGRKLRGWLLAQALAVLLALPFVPLALGQVRGYVPPGAQRLGVADFLTQVWGAYMGGTLAVVGHLATFDALAAAAAVVFVVGVALLLWRDPARGRDLLLLSYVAVPLTLIFLTMWLRPGFHPRYVVLLSAPLLILVARVIAFFATQGRWGWLVSVPTALVFVAAFATGASAFYGDSHYQRDDVRAVTARLERSLGADDAVLLDHPDYAVDFYYSGVAPSHTIEMNDTDASIIGQVAEDTQGRRRIALVSWAQAHSDHRGFLAWLLEGSGRRVRTWSVSDLLVREYDLERPVTLPSFQAAQGRFGPMTLTGVYTPPPTPADTSVPLALRWRAAGVGAAELDSPKVSVALLDAAGRTVASQDAFLVDAAGRPPAAWEPGQDVVNVYSLALPPGTPPVTYDVSVAVYDGATLRPIDALDAAGAATGARATVGQVALSHAQRFPTSLDAKMAAVNVSAADGLALEQAAVDRSTVAPGEPIEARLRWRATQDGLPDWPMRLELTQNGRVIAEAAGAPADGKYPTSQWAANEVVLDRRTLRAPADAAAGAATLQVRVGDGAPISLATLQVQAPQRVMQAPPVQQAVGADFPSAIRLVGYDVASEAIPAGGRVSLRLTWQATDAPGSKPLTVFTHLLDANGRVIAQHDSPPANGSRPTTGWTAGEFVADAHDMTVGGDYTGEASIEIGLYDPATGERVRTADGADHVVLPTRIKVNPR
ncbi:MAG: glycosyltransferase family 39 protein [Anaerolineae bacterium]